MNTQIIEQLVMRLAKLSRQEFSKLDLKEKYNETKEYEPSDLGVFINDITDTAQRIGLILVSNTKDRASLNAMISRLEYPILVFSVKDRIIPYLIYEDEKGKIRCYDYSRKDPFEVENPQQIIPQLHEGLDGKKDDVFFMTIYPLYTLVSDLKDVRNKSEGDKALTPVKRFWRLINSEKKDITYIYVYAIAVGLVSLALPLGIQAIIGLISGGMVFNTVILLIGLVILAVLISGGLQVMQITMVEILQRRVFTKATYEFAYRIPRINSESLVKNYPPELVNRFFDVLTIQKGLPKVLIEVTASLLQIFFGLILLAFYHPFFIAFGLGLLFILFLIFYFTAEKGLTTNLMESKYKYKTAHWLEEMARTVTSFKLAGQTNLPIQKADSYVNKYLYYRKAHFRVLLTQYINIVVFKTLIIGGLLALGTYLVVDRQITLGQFVASELIVVLIFSNVEKIILSLDIVYDLLTGLEKVGNVTDLPLERTEGIKTGLLANERGMSIHIKDLKYTYPGAPHPTLNGINLDIMPGERVCLAGFNGSGRDTLAKIIYGLNDSFKGVVTLNGISIRDIHLPTLRDNIDKNVSQEDIFEGSILENITMGRTNVKYTDVIWALDNLGLSDTLNGLPEGLHTEMTAGGKILSGSALGRLTLARCVASRPKLLIVNDFMASVERREKLKITAFLHDESHPWTLMTISNDPIMLAAADKVILMREGKVETVGSFDELKNNQYFQDVMHT